MKKLLFNTQFLVLLLLIAGISANAQALEWVQSMGGTGNDESRSLVTDKEGNVYITGTFNGTADFNQRRGIDTLKSAGATDIYLAKYNAAGNYQWAIRMGGTSADYGRGVAVDTSGNVYVTGYFVLKATFNPAGGDTLYAGAGFNDIFIAKYNSQGVYQWAINVGGSAINYGYGIDVSAAGEVYVTGSFSGKSDFDPSPAPGDTAFLSAYPVSFFNPGYDIFIAKYDTDGKYLWAKSAGSSTTSDYGYAVAVDKLGNAYVTGYYSSWANFDPSAGIAVLESISGNFAYDGFLAKYDKDGKHLWAKGMGSKADDNGLGVAVDEDFNVYVTGYFSDTAYFYDTTSTPGAAIKSDSLISAGNYDMFLAKYDSAGNYFWSKTLGGSGDELGMNVSVGRGGIVCVTGYFADTAVFNGADTLRAVAGSREAFIAKFSPQGDYKWAGSLGGSQGDIGYGISCDRLGNIYATGNYTGAADLEPGPGAANFLSKGGTDIYLLKLLCSDTSSSVLHLKGCGESFAFNGSIYTSSGTYKQILTNYSGCDSAITVHLELSNPEAVIDADEYTLSTTMPFTTYKWLRDGVALPGATDSALLVTANGRYQVVVTNDDGCIDTSAVYTVTNVGIDDNKDIETQIKVYPNPAGNVIHIASPVAVNVLLTTVEGRSVMHVDNARSLSLEGFPAGVYFLRISDKENKLIRTDKIIKK